MSIVSSESKPGWAKIKFLYSYSANMSLEATSELADNPVSNILNRLETNYWQSAITTTQYITDLNAPTEATNYLILYGHNLATAGATVTIQATESAGDWSSPIDLASGSPTSDEIFYLEVPESTGQGQRIKIENATVAPKITIGYWGQITELDWASISFDPNSQRNRDDVNKSETGFVLGVYTKYTERTQRFAWIAAELDMYDDEIEPWFDEVGKQNFFTAWDITDHPTEIFLMYNESGNLNAPYTTNGLYRDISVDLTGRKV